MGETEVSGIMRKLDDHETIFRDITGKLATIDEKLKGYPEIVKQTNVNTTLIIEQTKRCSEIQNIKKSKKELLNLIKVGIIVGIIVAIVTAAITIGLSYTQIESEVSTHETEQVPF